MNATIIYKELSDHIIGLALEVHRTLGAGLLESAYEEAICVQFRFFHFIKGKKPELPGRIQKHPSIPLMLLDSARELRHAGIPHERQKVYPLKYKGDYISSYFADLVVDGKIILEIKSVKAFDKNMEAVAECLLVSDNNQQSLKGNRNSPIHGTPRH